MIKARNIFVFITILSLVFSSCRRQSMQLRSSVRKTQNDVRYFNRDVNKVKNFLGIEEGDNTENLDSSSQTLFTPIDQKNIFTTYGYVYDAINGSKDVINSSNFYWDSIQKVYYVRNKKYSKIKPIVPDEYVDNVWIRDRSGMKKLKPEKVFQDIVRKIK